MDAQTVVLEITAGVLAVQTMVLAATWRSISTNTEETGRLCEETGKLREATEALHEEAVRQTSAMQRPVVIPRLLLDPVQHFSKPDRKFNLHNYGKGIALNIELLPIEGSEGPIRFNTGVAAPRNWLREGEDMDVVFRTFVDDNKVPTEGSIQYWFFTDVPGPEACIRVLFDDVEGNSYRMTAHIPANPNGPRVVSAGKIEKIKR